MKDNSRKKKSPDKSAEDLDEAPQAKMFPSPIIGELLLTPQVSWSSTNQFQQEQVSSDLTVVDIMNAYTQDYTLLFSNLVGC